ncbi:PaaI family thioesterase [Schleiferiaceae bacterium]|nr:PaaI family thioesterase [Schleiferiaceae bacterium]
MNERRAGTLMETLGIEYISKDNQTLRGRMPVTSNHLQPAGILHGGATLALAETIGSAASNIFLDDPDSFIAVGQEIAANHVKSASNGYVYAESKFLHKGRTSHVLEIRITNDDDNLISFVKMTNAILPKKN